jgi:hypothetical protein
LLFALCSLEFAILLNQSEAHLTRPNRSDTMRGTSAGTIEDMIKVGPGATEEPLHVPR